MCNAFLLSLSSGIIKEIFCVHSSLAKEPGIDYEAVELKNGFLYRRFFAVGGGGSRVSLSNSN